MRVVDTNVIVRFCARDDEAQALSARKIFEEGEVLVLAGILMEVEWVLRSRFKFTPKLINDMFTSLLGLPGVQCDDPFNVERALAAHQRGIDFADALHLAGSDVADEFLTFDRELARLSTKVSGFVPVRML